MLEKLFSKKWVTNLAHASLMWIYLKQMYSIDRWLMHARSISSDLSICSNMLLVLIRRFLNFYCGLKNHGEECILLSRRLMKWELFWQKLQETLLRKKGNKNKTLCTWTYNCENHLWSVKTQKELQLTASI